MNYELKKQFEVKETLDQKDIHSNPMCFVFL